MIDFRKELSEVQFKAVTYVDSPELVIAGAGSGKTRVLTYKIAYLLERGLEPNRILALTFTNKAAKEMRSRIGILTDEKNSKKLVMGTFHSVFLKILKNEIKIRPGVLPFTPSFTIYDTDDSEKTIKDIVERMNLDATKYVPSELLKKISNAKNHSYRPEEYAKSELYLRDRKVFGEIFEIYKKYALSLVKANAMDFDDLLLMTYVLFKENEEIRKKYALWFRYCLVDEYQDTNLLQKDVLMQLTKESNRLFAVGDDAQSIYAFRGAVIANILGFTEDFPGAVTFKLEENYRSTKNIVEAANGVIMKNKRQIFKSLFSNREGGDKIQVEFVATDRYETKNVVTAIKHMVSKNGRNFGDFAILYRSNWLSRGMEDELRRECIPYKVFGCTSFYQRKEVKDVMAYFRLVVNTNDDQALRRVINYPTRGIGGTTMEKFVGRATRENIPLWSVIANPFYYPSGISKKTVDKISSFVLMITNWRKDARENADVLAERICKESGIIRTLSFSRKAEDLERLENVHEVIASVKQFVRDHKNENGDPVTIEDYVREVALLSDADDERNEKNIPCVKLMTVHASKGLEFPVVFVIGMEENVFPCKQVVEIGGAAYEEERRLFYVAMTRAKDVLILSGAGYRYRFGNYMPAMRSEFIDDIGKDYLEYQ